MNPCPKCGGQKTRVLKGGYVHCDDCAARELERSLRIEAIRFAGKFERSIKDSRQFRKSAYDV